MGVLGFLFIGLFGFILMVALADQGTIAMYVSSCITCCGLYPAYPLSLAWLTKNTGGHTKRALAISCFMATGQLGGIVSSQVSF